MVLRTILLGLPIGITFLSTVGSVARVDGVSMQPVLNPENGSNDYVFLNRWTIRGFQVKRGDIVSVISPKDTSSILIKRIIALEGDIIQTKKADNSLIQVPTGHCWVEGENHTQSMDSNHFGPIPLGLIIAKATHIIYPFSRAGRLS